LGNGPRPKLSTGRNRQTLVNIASHQDLGAKLSPGRRAKYSQPEAVSKGKDVAFTQQQNMKKLMDASKPQQPVSKPADFSRAQAAHENSAALAMNLLSMAATMKKAKQATGGGGRPDAVPYTAGAGPGTQFQGGTPEQNIRLGRSMAKEAGWTGAQWRALKTLWMRESSWRSDADNPTSTAYGIPQRLGSVHGMPKRYRRNPKVQIAWGLNYILGTYGDPLTALQHSNQEGWY
jgi:hypothetical protein